MTAQVILLYPEGKPEFRFARSQRVGSIFHAVKSSDEELLVHALACGLFLTFSDAKFAEREPRKGDLCKACAPHVEPVRSLAGDPR